MKKLWNKYKEFILYIISGIIVTAVSWVSYYISYDVLHISNLLSEVISWVLAVAVAYISNKLMVFKSYSWDRKVVLPELGKFVSARLFSFAIEFVLMWLTVDIMKFNGLIMKMLVSVIVVLLNYFAGKHLVFKKEDNK